MSTDKLTNEEKLENLHVLLASVKAAPTRAIDLSNFRNACGTVFCMAGMLPHIPHFASKYGVEAGYNGVPHNPQYSLDALLVYLFGTYPVKDADEGCYFPLFCSVSSIDDNLEGKPTQKKLAINRLQWAIRHRTQHPQG